MNSYDTDEDFDELERYIIDNETTDDDDIAEDLEDAVSEGSDVETESIDENQVFISRDGSQWYTEPPLVNSKFLIIIKIYTILEGLGWILYLCLHEYF